MRNIAFRARILHTRSNVTPPWLLYFLRLARECDQDYAIAWQLLPELLPIEVPCPSLLECATVLADHGLS